MKMKRLGMLMLLLWISCLSLAGIASAASSYTISPVKTVEEGRGYYMDKVQPGDTNKYSFIVRNITNKPLELQLYPADALPAQNGGRSFSERAQKLRLVGSWISPQGTKSVRLKPNEERTFTYSVKVPKDIKPGQYVGVVAAEEYQPAQTHSGNSTQATLAIDVLNRTGVQMVLEYKPEQAVHAMSIDAFAHDYIPAGNSRLTIDLSDTGTILEKPKGKIIVRDSKNAVMYQSDYAADSIYEGTTANMVYVVNDKLLLPDTYSVYYEATFSGKTISRTFYFTVTREQSELSKDALTEAGKIEVNQTFEDWIWQHLWIIIVIILLFILILIIAVWLAFALSKRKKKDDESKQNQNNHIPANESGAGSS
ncbi:hypothetical protein D3C75_307750 [compost metagenome]